MRSAVFSSFFHAVSTNEDPHHHHCPAGTDSWCFHQRAVAKGEELGSHQENVGTALNHDVAEQVKDVYLRLSHPKLLRCGVKGKTQITNESLRSKVWRKCPKTGFVGRTRVVAATCTAVAEFNQGVMSTVTHSQEVKDMSSGG